MGLKEKKSPDLEIFQDGQIWVLKNGRMIYIHSVHPFTRLTTSDADRTVEYLVVGSSENKKLETDTVDLIDERNNIRFRVYTEHVYQSNYEYLAHAAAHFSGSVKEEKIKMINKILNENMED